MRNDINNEDPTYELITSVDAVHQLSELTPEEDSHSELLKMIDNRLREALRRFLQSQKQTTDTRL